jgi:uroporphyrinogen-III decarboxylase
LEDIRGVPAGKVIWGFDNTDMVQAKKSLGEEACLTGNVSSSLLELGTTDDVKQYVRKLIDTVGRDGGYIMMNGATLENVKPENVKTMIEVTREYGVY